MSNARDVITTLRKKKEAIRYDSDLTEAGKAKAYAKLATEMQAARKLTFQALEAQWGTIRAQSRNIEARRGKAKEKEAARWDYNRLAFEVDQVSRAIENAAKNGGGFGLSAIGMLKHAYGQTAGDIVKRRAWAEQADKIRATFRDADALAFARQLKRELTQLTTTPELQQLEAEGRELVSTVDELIEETETAKSFYGGEVDLPAALAAFHERRSGNAPATSTQPDLGGKFESLMAGVHLSKRYHAPSVEDEAAGMMPGIEISLEIED